MGSRGHRDRPAGGAVRVVGGTMLRSGANRVARQAKGTSIAFLLMIAPAMGSGCHGAARPRDVGEVRIDMTSEESATRSMARLRDTLDAHGRSAFLHATMVLVDREMSAPGDMAAADPVLARAAVRKVLDGRTAAEVIAAARG